MNVPQELFAEASTLGFRPGQWPLEFKYRDLTWTYVGEDRDNENELVAVIYRSGTRRLQVIND